MNYGEVLSKSWKIIWKFKILWLFGIFAALGAQTNSISSSMSNLSYQISNTNRYSAGGSLTVFNQFFSSANNLLSNIPVWISVIVGLVIFILSAAFILLSVLGQIGSIRGAWLADDGVSKLTFASLFKESRPFFWRICLLIILLLFVVIFSAVAMVVAFIAFGIATLGIGLICLIPFFCLMIPISILFNLVIEQSIIAIIGEDLGVIDGLKRGWQVIEKNPASIVVMALIIFAGKAIVDFVIGVPALIIFVPIFLAVIGNTQATLVAGLTIALAGFITYAPVALFLQGVLQSYLNTAWTLTFRRLTIKKEPPAIIEAVKPEGPVEPPSTTGQETQIAPSPLAEVD